MHYMLSKHATSRRGTHDTPTQHHWLAMRTVLLRRKQFICACVLARTWPFYWMDNQWFACANDDGNVYDNVARQMPLQAPSPTRAQSVAVYRGHHQNCVWPTPECLAHSHYGESSMHRFCRACVLTRALIHRDTRFTEFLRRRLSVGCCVVLGYVYAAAFVERNVQVRETKWSKCNYAWHSRCSVHTNPRFL